MLFVCNSMTLFLFSMSSMYYYSAKEMACGKSSARVSVNVTTDACVEGQCSDHGRCHNYLNGQVLFSTCKCYAVSKPTIESKLISLKDFVIRNTTSCLPSTLFACHSDILKLLC